MKRTITIAMLAALVMTGTVTAAPNFVDNNLPLPSPKTDRVPPTNVLQQWTANDANTVFGALTDLRTVAKRAHISVEAFGALCDGVHDDATAINLALTAAGLTHTGTFGGIVTFPARTCLVGSQSIAIPNGVELRGEGPGTLIKAAGTADLGGHPFSQTSLIHNALQDGTQEYAMLTDLQIDGNRGGGATESEAVVSWGSLFVTSSIRNVTIMNASNIGLHLFAAGSPGGSGPVQLENLWVLHSGNDNVFIEDGNSLALGGPIANSGAMAGLTFLNLVSEHPDVNNVAAVNIKGAGRLGQVNFFQTHIEMGGTQTGRIAVKVDGCSHCRWEGMQLQTGTPGNMAAGIQITAASQNVDLQFGSVTNINLINPVLSDLKNSVTLAGVNIPVYWTPDVVLTGVGVAFQPAGSANHGWTANDTSGTARLWTTNTGSLTGSSANGAGIDIQADAVNNRLFTMQDNAAGHLFELVYPGGGGGVVRWRYRTGGVDLSQWGTDGSTFWYQPMTLQSSLTLQSNLVSTGTIPTLSSCGTGPSILAGSTNTSGRFTTGTGATTCTLTFAGTYTNAPTCQVNMQGSTGTPATPVYAETTTTIPMTSAVVASATYRYTCVGH